jgi:hypothetical protein
VCSPFFFFFSAWLGPMESGTHTIERADQRSSQANVGDPDSISRAISLLGRCLTPTRTRGLTTTKTELTQKQRPEPRLTTTQIGNKGRKNRKQSATKT